MAYYDLGGVREALPRRLQALREVLPAGSRLLDLGCNDGRIGRALQESGHASTVLGVDLERAPDYQGQEFLARDLRSGDLEGLPPADAVLFLNVAHHLVLQGRAFVADLLARMLQRWPVVLLDMGSISEGADWPWRRLLGRIWPSDAAMWAELFAAARWRRPLLAYPFQGGRRVLWKLVGENEPEYDFEEVDTYRRNETNHPLRKRFYAGGAAEAYQGVLFRTLRRRGTQELFWAKQSQLWRDQPERHRFEDEVEKVVKGLPVLASLSLRRHPQFGRIYPYLPELHAAQTVHYNWRRLFLSPSQCRQAELVAQACAPEGPLANLPLGLITDFQCAVTSFGLLFLDWEPDHQQPTVEEVVKEGEPARRRLLERLYSPVNSDSALERCLDGAVQPFPPLDDEQRLRLATELLRRAQHLKRCGQWKWAKVNYREAFGLGPPALVAWFRLLGRHWWGRLRKALGRSK